MAGTIDDYNEILAQIRVGEVVAAALRAGVAELHAEGRATKALERELVVKELQIGLLKMRRDELAEDLFPTWQNEKPGRRNGN